MNNQINNVGALNTPPYPGQQRNTEKANTAGPTRDKAQIEGQQANRAPEEIKKNTAANLRENVENPKPTDLAELNKPSNPQSPIAPENVIRNTKVAYESANTIKAQMTAQPGVAMLAQANANPALVVNLLK